MVIIITYFGYNANLLKNKKSTRLNGAAAVGKYSEDMEN
jgi:hypothetical protein